MAVRSDSLTFRVACAVSLGLSAIRQELATISQVEIIDLSPHSKGIGSDHECQGLVIYASQFSSSIADWIQKNPLEWIHLVTAGSDPLDAINISDSLHLSSSGHFLQVNANFAAFLRSTRYAILCVRFAPLRSKNVSKICETEF